MNFTIAGVRVDLSRAPESHPGSTPTSIGVPALRDAWDEEDNFPTEVRPNPWPELAGDVAKRVIDRIKPEAES